MKLILIVLTQFFSFDPKDFNEGVGYRYVGFYGSLIRSLFKISPKSSAFWYSVRDHCLRVINEKGYKERKISLTRAVISVISETCRKKSYLVVVVAFPTALPKVNRIFEYIFALSLFRLFSIKCVKLIIDDFDPPVEALYAFSETKPSLAAVMYARVIEKVTLKLASSIVTISEFWKKYIMRIYGVKEKSLFVVSNGSLTRLVPHDFKKLRRPFVVLYSGSAWIVKDIDKLVSTIENMRVQGMDIELHIAGAKLMDLPSWVHITQSNWKSFVSNVLANSDVCVIPYPPTKFAFFHSMPAKLFDYMAAGKPVISTNLKEAGDIILSNNCGFVARNWTEFEAHLKRLYEDAELSTKLGNNSRVTAEKYFDYEKLAETFLENVVKTLRL